MPPGMANIRAIRRCGRVVGVLGWSRPFDVRGVLGGDEKRNRQGVTGCCPRLYP